MNRFQLKQANDNALDKLVRNGVFRSKHEAINAGLTLIYEALQKGMEKATPPPLSPEAIEALPKAPPEVI